MKIDKSIFKQYDIRGVVGENLDAPTAYLIGKGFGTYAQIKGVKEVMIGHDNRISSEEMYISLMKGLLDSGCDVTEIGLTLTPIIDFSWYELNAPATIMVTASHSPVRYNGFKLAAKKTLVFGEELQKIYRYIKQNKLKKGKGKRKSTFINEKYVEYISSHIQLKKKLNVVLDCGNGTGSILAPQLFHNIGCNLTLFHCISDGSFPHHDPYPQKVEGYRDHFIKALQTKKYDIGIALDGDCDRMGIFDEEGNFIENDKIMYIHAKEILKHHPQCSFVVNVAVSQAVIEGIQQRGGTVNIWKTGPPHLLPKIKETKALLGGEISGHVVFADRYFGFDDGIYTACRTIELLSQGKKKISQYFQDLPKYFATPEFRVFAGERNLEVIEKIAAELRKNKDFTIIDVDGLRVTTPKGWFLIRPSQTEPLVTGRVEAKTQSDLVWFKEFLQTLLSQHGVRLDWNNPIVKH